MKIVRLFFYGLVFCLFLANVTVTNAQPNKSQNTDVTKNSDSTKSGYHLSKNINVGGEGGWDYLTVDSKAHRLYVSHSSKAVVIDIDKEKVIGEIPNTNGIHGIAIATDLGRGFTSNGKDSTVTIFDLQTLKTLGTVKTGINPDAIIYDEQSHYIFTFNGGSNNCTVIDGAKAEVVGTIALGGKPEFAAVDGKGKIFVNIEDTSEVVAVDTHKFSVLSRWPLKPGEEPTGMAIDLKQRKLFIGCSNNLMVVMDADNGHIMATLPIGKGVDGVAFDPDSKLAFSSNGEGTVTVIQESSDGKYTVLENVKTKPGARTIALDLSTHKIFLATAQFGDPPAPTKEQPHPRRSIVAGSFEILVLDTTK